MVIRFAPLGKDGPGSRAGRCDGASHAGPRDILAHSSVAPAVPPVQAVIASAPGSNLDAEAVMLPRQRLRPLVAVDGQAVIDEDRRERSDGALPGPRHVEQGAEQSRRRDPIPRRRDEVVEMACHGVHLRRPHLPRRYRGHALLRRPAPASSRHRWPGRRIHDSIAMPDTGRVARRFGLDLAVRLPRDTAREPAHRRPR